MQVLLSMYSNWKCVFTWRRSLTRSIGATAVFEIAAAVPPASKSFANPMKSKDFPVMIGVVVEEYD